MGKFGFGMNSVAEAIDPFITYEGINGLPFTEENFNELKERYLRLLKDDDDVRDDLRVLDKRYRTCMDQYIDTTNELKDARQTITDLHKRLAEKERLISRYIDMLNSNHIPDDQD